jgi:hypothetical protein
LADLPDARIEQDFAELQRVSELIDAERLRRLAEIDRRGLFQGDGHLSAASWLASTFRMAWGAARNQVRTARALEGMPETRRALDEGELSMSAVRVLVAAREADARPSDAARPPWSTRPGCTRYRTSGAWPRTGARPWNVRQPWTGGRNSGNAGGSTPP